MRWSLLPDIGQAMMGAFVDDKARQSAALRLPRVLVVSFWAITERALDQITDRIMIHGVLADADPAVFAEVGTVEEIFPST